MTLDLGEKMSNLYMTTEEFAALVVESLHEQNYFKRESKNHPYDIAISFATVGESIGTAMSWAISKEHEAKKGIKEAMMKTGDLSKNVSGSWSTSSSSTYNPTVATSNYSYGHSHTLPEDDEIAPSTIKGEDSLDSPKDALEYSEWRKKGYL